MDPKVQRAMRKASARLQRNLEKTMTALWNDKAFRKRLDDETAGVNKKNFMEYCKEAAKHAQEEK